MSKTPKNVSKTSRGVDNVAGLVNDLLGLTGEPPLTRDEEAELRHNVIEAHKHGEGFRLDEEQAGALEKANLAKTHPERSNN